MREPYRNIRLKLAENDSELSYDLTWLRSSPAYLKAHHTATKAAERPPTSRATPKPALLRDGSNSTESGRGGAPDWYGSRDHSWGVYFEHPPLAADPKWLPPVGKEGTHRAFRFWTLFGSGELSGFYAVNVG